MNRKSLLRLVAILVCAILPSRFAICQTNTLPAEAIASWEKNRLSLVDFFPTKLSSESLTVEIKYRVRNKFGERDVSEDRVVVISKLGNDLRVSETENQLEKVRLFTSGKFYLLTRSIGTDNWTLRDTSSYTNPNEIAGENLDHPIIAALNPYAGDFNHLWGFGLHNFGKILPGWDNPIVVSTENSLSVSTVLDTGKNI